mgnify:FL=1
MQGMTRRRALEHCLTLLEAQARCFSTNFSLLCAREGYEQAQGETVEAMEKVREMMREEREREEEAARELAEKRKLDGKANSKGFPKEDKSKSG